MHDTSSTAPATRDAPSELRRIRTVAVATLVALIALGLAWELVLAPLRPGGSLWALKVVPLVFPLAGFLRHRMYTYRWVSLLVWLYFAEGVMRAWNDPVAPAWLPLTQVALCLVLFAACAMHVRTRLGWGRKAT
ncbi:DUF2069 domain-containing protein [Ramlibacter tataouinensis]|nr:DUF2069 domain-containing protein [Ramlibacter tataouinensis]